MYTVTDNFQLDVSVTKIDKRELLLLENPHYEKVLAEHPHLRGVHMDDDDEKSQLPVHLILGANDFAKIRTGERLCVGRRGDPVAEFTRFGWALCHLEPRQIFYRCTLPSTQLQITSAYAR